MILKIFHENCQNDRKKTESLLIYNSKEMRIFDRKILEVAIIRIIFSKNGNLESYAISWNSA